MSAKAEKAQVRDTESMHALRPDEDGVARVYVCKCGCEQKFLRTRTWQKFVDSQHRDRFWTKARKEAARKMLEE